MVMNCEAQPRRTGRVAYPCIACGSPVEPGQVYCAVCLRAMAERQREECLDPDAILERLWLRSQIENEQAA
jgi:predicted nucleic acid-binding Zn ribbon protein